jgi:hypothetical protein
VSAVPSGWSFLVARGRRKGYRTVLAPEFLIARNLHSVLSESSDGASMDPDGVRTTELDIPEVGPITVCFRTEGLTSADLDSDGAATAEPATDQHGRPLEILYGIVSRHPLSGPIAGADLRRARAEAVRAYQRFLEEEDGFGVDDSAPFPLRSVTRSPQRARTPIDASGAAPAVSAAPTPKRRSISIRVAALAALATLVVAWLVHRGDSGPGTQIRNATARTASNPARCDQDVAFVLTATIAATGDTNVTYHWESGGTKTPRRTRHFDRNGSASVREHISRHVAGSGPVRFMFVVDDPQPGHREVASSVRCAAIIAAPLPPL